MQMRVVTVALLLLSTIFAGCVPRAASPPPPSGQQDQAPVVGVVLRDFEFEPRPLRVRAGKVRFQLMNRGTVEHDFAIPSLRGHDDHDKHLLKPGETKTIELELTPGTYEAICTIPGHKEAGMVINIQVGS